MASSFLLTLDTTAPQGVTLELDGGAIYTGSQTVSAALSTTDLDTTGYQFKVYGDVVGAPTVGVATWQAYTATTSINLTPGDGLKTVYLVVRDDVGNESLVASDSITLDQTAPVVTISSGPAPTKISKVTGFAESSFTFQTDTDIVEWQVRVVPDAGSPHTAGTLIGTTNGSTNTSGAGLLAATNQPVTIHGADLEAASAGDGDKRVKVFARDETGNWSL